MLEAAKIPVSLAGCLIDAGYDDILKNGLASLTGYTACTLSGRCILCRMHYPATKVHSTRVQPKYSIQALAAHEVV